MIQISFEPAFDPYHTIFRLLRFCASFLGGNCVHRDQIRIIDFYFVFPFKLSDIKLKREHGQFRHLANKYADLRPYGGFPDGSNVFERMALIHDAALQTMAVEGYLDSDWLKKNMVQYTKKSLPISLFDRIQQLNKDQYDLLDCMKTLASYSLLGNDGLKRRSGLMEHRYDAI